MQVYEKTGDIEKGTITLSLSKAEIGYKDILFIMDYHRIGKNKYSISLFVQEKGNDMFYLCDNRDIEYRYSELERFLKDLTFRSLNKKVLQHFCKEYMAELGKMYEIKSIETDVLLIVHEQGRGNYITLNTVEIENIKKALKEDKESLYSIRFTIDYREEGEYGEWETIKCSLSGTGKELRDFLAQVHYQTTLRYETITTYDENYTNIIIRFNSCGAQEEIKLSMRNSNRYFIEKLERYIEKRSFNIVHTNNYKEVMSGLYQNVDMLIS